MLRANVGLSRKVSRNFQSDGYTVNLDAEINTSPDDPDAVLERIHELFNLAEEALAKEIDRDQGESAIGRRDEPRPEPPVTNNNGQPAQPSAPTQPRQETNGNNGGHQGQDQPATNKQVQFLLTIGKRIKLSTQQLEARIADIIGRRSGIYDLTKKEAGRVLDQLTNGGNVNGNNHQRS